MKALEVIPVAYLIFIAFLTQLELETGVNVHVSADEWNAIAEQGEDFFYSDNKWIPDAIEKPLEAFGTLLDFGLAYVRMLGKALTVVYFTLPGAPPEVNNFFKVFVLVPLNVLFLTAIVKFARGLPP